MNSRLKVRWSAIGAAVGLLAGLGAMPTVASAAPTLSIVQAITGNEEVTGDAGGTNYAAGFGTANGPGLPSVAAGWPNTGAGLGTDPSFGNAIGTTGYHSAYLELSKAADVTFQFMGNGNAGLSNLFGLDFNSNGVLDAGERLFQGGVTTACAMFGGVTPVCDQLAGGFGAQNQYTFTLQAGRIAFLYVTGNGVTLDNTGNGLGNPDPHSANLPGYFLGMDPYLATGQYQTSGTAVYAGLSDLPAPGDHDFQDLGVRISVVPEPGSLALAGIAMAGLLAAGRRRPSNAAPTTALPA